MPWVYCCNTRGVAHLITDPWHHGAMADLEKHALKRDRRFLVRLVLAVLVGAGVGMMVFVKMTDPRIATCAADAFQTHTESE
jgi:hypothetical protein